jgi:chemotaxis protein CheD
MDNPRDIIEIFLQPGECYFSDRNTRIRTVLGSCVAITFWHPVKLIGGMCHFMLPSRLKAQQFCELDGRYGDEALSLLLNEIHDQGTHPEQYEIKVFGGGDMFPDRRKKSGIRIGERNIEQALALLNALDLQVSAHHLGGKGHRSLIFDLWSGHVWLKHAPTCPNP